MGANSNVEWDRFIDRSQKVIANRSENSAVLTLVPQELYRNEFVCHMLSYGMRPIFYPVMLSKLVNSFCLHNPENKEAQRVKKLIDRLWGIGSTDADVTKGLN